MSGTTRSIPNISSSGNIRPQSMTTMSSPYSNTYMFLPISPTPPSGMMRRIGLGVVGIRGGGLVSWVEGSEDGQVGRRGLGDVAGGGRDDLQVAHRDGFDRLDCLSGPRRRWGPALASVQEGARRPPDVVVALALDRRRPQRRRGVVHGKDGGVASAG